MDGAHQRRRRLNRLFLSCLAWAIGLAGQARAQDAPWDGLQALKELAQQAGHPLRGGDRVDIGVLDARDGVLIVGPSSELPVGALGAFLDAGGRLAVLDDFGTADALLRAYRIERGAAPTRGAVRLRDDPDLLLAEPDTSHPLARDVQGLLTNRPVALRHELLKPVFTFAGTDDALVLAGAVGAGRLVSVGDASLLINQLLALPDQRRFADNLLEYLSASGGELWLVGPDQTLFGRFGQPHRPGVQRLNALMAKLSQPDLPQWLILVLAASAVMAATVWVLGSLPKVTPYLTRRALPSPRVWAGFAGRIASARDSPDNLLWALLDYRRELLSGCARALGVDRPVDGRPLLEAAQRRDLSQGVLRALGSLFGELDALAAAEEQAAPLPRVDPEQLRRVVTTGERLVRDLEMAAA